mmetsp:Transcript_10627/g.23047  ORF Transcript_10627/g.23047 Transcript_10627/m.23047 type:complete len:171 (+) Transcript_10627:475-987(+)
MQQLAHLISVPPPDGTPLSIPALQHLREGTDEGPNNNRSSSQDTILATIQAEIAEQLGAFRQSIVQEIASSVQSKQITPQITQGDVVQLRNDMAELTKTLADLERDSSAQSSHHSNPTPAPDPSPNRTTKYACIDALSTKSICEQFRDDMASATERAVREEMKVAKNKMG